MTSSRRALPVRHRCCHGQQLQKPDLKKKKKPLSFILESWYFPVFPNVFENPQTSALSGLVCDGLCDRWCWDFSTQPSEWLGNCHLPTEYRGSETSAKASIWLPSSCLLATCIEILCAKIREENTGICSLSLCFSMVLWCCFGQQSGAVRLLGLGQGLWFCHPSPSHFFGGLREDAKL